MKQRTHRIPATMVLLSMIILAPSCVSVLQSQASSEGDKSTIAVEERKSVLTGDYGEFTNAVCTFDDDWTPLPDGLSRLGVLYKGEIPKGWVVEHPGPGDGKPYRCVMTHITKGAAQGTGALRIEVTKKQTRRPITIKHEVPFTMDKYIRIKLMLRSGTGCAPRVGLRTWKKPYKYYWGDKNYVQTSPEWQEYEFTVLPDPKAPEPVHLFIVISDNAELEIDNLSVMHMSEADLSEGVELAEGNLLPNTSLPFGLPSLWSRGRLASDNAIQVYSDKDEIGPTGVPALTVVPATSKGTARKYTPGMRGMQIVSPAYNMIGGEEYTMSLYAKAEYDEQEMVIRLQDSQGTFKGYLFKATKEWKRYHFTHKIRFDQKNYNIMIVESLDRFWSDGLQVEEGDLTEFKRGGNGAVEITLSATTYKGLFLEGEEMTVKYAVLGKTDDSMQLKAAIIDINGKRREFTLPLPNENEQQTLKLATERLARYGTFRLEMRVYDENDEPLSPWAECLFHRVRVPKKYNEDAPDSPFGIHVNAYPEDAEMVKRLGFNWVRPHDCGGNITKWYELEKKEGVWAFEEKDRAADVFRSHNLMGTSKNRNSRREERFFSCVLPAREPSTGSY